MERNRKDREEQDKENLRAKWSCLDGFQRMGQKQRNLIGFPLMNL